jgi:hypothetical protein
MRRDAQIMEEYLLARGIGFPQCPKCKELTEENERLRSENEALAISEVKECEISQMLVYRIRNKHPAVMAVIADTVKKLTEMLTTFFANDETLEYTEVDAEYINEQIGRIANELMEGKNATN